jgi:hypothetical protein
MALWPEPAAFLAEHAPSLQVRDGPPDGGLDRAEASVEFGLAFVQLAAAGAKRNDGDAVGAGVGKSTAVAILVISAFSPEAAKA